MVSLPVVVGLLILVENFSHRAATMFVTEARALDDAFSISIDEGFSLGGTNRPPACAIVRDVRPCAIVLGVALGEEETTDRLPSNLGEVIGVVREEARGEVCGGGFPVETRLLVLAAKTWRDSVINRFSSSLSNFFSRMTTLGRNKHNRRARLVTKRTTDRSKAFVSGGETL